MKHRTTKKRGFNYICKSQYKNNTQNDKEEDENCDDDTDDGSVISVGNRIYFYSEVSKQPILSLNKKLKRLSTEILFKAIETDTEPTPIYLHINSPGGSALDGLLGMDYISNSKVPVYTIIDGECCSAATFLSIVGNKRFMNKNSICLIHQLSTTLWGSYSNLEDEMQNCKLIMDKIVKAYQNNTKLPLKKLEQILQHDLYFDSETCLRYGIIDEIL